MPVEPQCTMDGARAGDTHRLIHVLRGRWVGVLCWWRQTKQYPVRLAATGSARSARQVQVAPDRYDSADQRKLLGQMDQVSTRFLDLSAVPLPRLQPILVSRLPHRQLVDDALG